MRHPRFSGVGPNAQQQAASKQLSKWMRDISIAGYLDQQRRQQNYKLIADPIGPERRIVRDSTPSLVSSQMNFGGLARSVVIATIVLLLAAAIGARW